MGLRNLLNKYRYDDYDEQLNKDLLKGVNTNTPEYLESMGEAAPQPTQRQTLADMLLGKPQTQVIGTDDSGNNIYSSEPIRTGGLLGNIQSGFRENYNNGFNLNNWGQGKKSIGERIGEGLGSAARIAQSPAGRALLMAGIVGATGGGALPAIAFGGLAGVGNQAYRMRDAMYRKQLQDSGIDTSDIRGYLDNDVYSNLVRAQQLKDNAEYRNAMLSNQQKQNEIMNQLRQDQLERQEKKDAIETQIALGNLGIAQGNLGLRQAEFNYKQYQDALEKANPKIDPKTKLALRDKTDALTQIQELRDLVNNNPGATGLVVGSLAKGKEISQKAANSISTDGQIRVRAGIAKLRGTTMHDLAGTAQTLQEQRNLAPFLPDATDDMRTINAKLDQLEAEIKREYNSINNAYGSSFGFNEQGQAINQTQQTPTQSNNSVSEGTIIKNAKTGQRMIMRNGKWQTL